MKNIDLHIHTNASDGEFSPVEIIGLAKEKAIKIIAITDHDSVEGFKNIADDKSFGIRVISGIEISCDDKGLGLTEIHVLGLFVNTNNPDLKKTVEQNKKRRYNQKQKIVERLNDLGYEITFGELVKEANGASFGRPHIAKILIRKYPKKFSSISQVFDALLGEGKIAYVAQERISIREAVSAITRAGGIPILAHPGIYLNKTERIIERFIELGGKGIEVYYPYNKVYGFSKDKSEKIIEKMKKIANEKNLIISGGSDFHGSSRSVEIGEQGLSEEDFKDLEDFYHQTFP